MERKKEEGRGTRTRRGNDTCIAITFYNVHFLISSSLSFLFFLPAMYAGTESCVAREARKCTWKSFVGKLYKLSTNLEDFRIFLSLS